MNDKNHNIYSSEDTTIKMDLEDYCRSLPQSHFINEGLKFRLNLSLITRDIKCCADDIYSTLLCGEDNEKLRNNLPKDFLDELEKFSKEFNEFNRVLHKYKCKI